MTIPIGHRTGGRYSPAMLTDQIDIYCERLGPGLWAEPVNALTNLAFIAVAVLIWRAPGIRGLPLARALAIALGLIGIGSGLFHSFATVWASIADVGAIAVFVLIYIHAANRDFLGLRGWTLWGALILSVPAMMALGALAGRLPLVGTSAAYIGVWALIVAYGLGLLRRSPATGRGLLIGAGILALSILLRSVDLPLCGRVPLGTHYLWHILNALMLGWMILVYRDHMVAGRRNGG